MKKKIIILYLLFLCSVTYGQSTKRVLFIGNSYTFRNGMPQMVASIASSMGDNITVAASVKSSRSFKEHYENASLCDSIKNFNWDYVVLQEKTELPALEDNTVEEDVFPYADSLNRIIKESNPCSETIFYMTWGRENGLSSHCDSWPPVCTYRGMDSLLNLRYRMMAERHNAMLSPVGAVWNYVRKNFPDIDLYKDDHSHPEYVGSYLAACSFYTTIFRKDPTLITYEHDSVTALDGARIRYAVKKVLYDSLATWHIGQYDLSDGFNYEVTGNRQVLFTSTSSVYAAGGLEWNFGDGSPVSNAASPVHTYSIAKTYNVSLTAHKPGCPQKDSVVKAVKIAAGNMRSGNEYSCSGTLYDKGGPTVNYPHMENDTLVIRPPGATSITMSFSKFKTYDGSDNLKIYNGLATPGNLLGTFSGSNIPAPITAGSGIMTLVFVSNNDGHNQSGWEATWSAAGCTYNKPIANFNAASTVINEGNSIQFNNTSSNVSIPTSYSWKFDGGTPATATTANPLVTYPRSGNYAVSLTATNAGGSTTKTVLTYIKVNRPALSDFTAASNSTVTAGDTVHFSDLSTGAPFAWYWDFEGATPSSSYLQNPSVIYPNPGEYNVSLTTANSSGFYITTKMKYIHVAPKVITMLKGKIVTAACTGTFYDDGGPNGNYGNSQKDTVIIQPVGATSVSITFSSFKTYNGNDKLTIYDGSFGSEIKNMYGGNEILTQPTKAAGGKMLLIFVSNGSNVEAGWKATWTATGGSCGTAISGNTSSIARLPAEPVQANSEVNVYPNPSNDMFLVTTAGDYERLSIYDNTGVHILDLAVTGKQTIVDFTGFPSGVYVIQLIGKSGVTTRKMILR